MKPIWIREIEDALYNSALGKIRRADDKSFVESDLENALAELIEIDANKEKHRRAKEIISGRARPGATDPAGQLILPGIGETYLYEPDRLIRDYDGHIVENCNASVTFKAADSNRARDHLNEVQVQANRKSKEIEVFAIWATREALRGRPALDLIWGNCVKESGFLQA